MEIHDSVLDLIGNTPLVNLKQKSSIFSIKPLDETAALLFSSMDRATYPFPDRFKMTSPFLSGLKLPAEEPVTIKILDGFWERVWSMVKSMGSSMTSGYPSSEAESVREPGTLRPLFQVPRK